jgi:DNA integrity scanning protein DisA with diadenylate cyclase activity
MFGLSLPDILDIGIVAFLIYQVLNMIKGTKAVQMLMGLVLLLIL